MVDPESKMTTVWFTVIIIVFICAVLFT